MLLHSCRRNRGPREPGARASATTAEQRQILERRRRTAGCGTGVSRGERGTKTTRDTYVFGRARTAPPVPLCEYTRGYLYIELNIRYIIHFKFFLLACPRSRGDRSYVLRAHNLPASLSLFFFPLRSVSSLVSRRTLANARSRTRATAAAGTPTRPGSSMYALRRVPSKLTSAQL